MAPGLLTIFQFGIFLFFMSSIAVGDEAAHGGAGGAPAACRNDFPLLKVNTWVNGAEKESLVGLSAGFGSILPEDIKQAQRLPAMFSKPLNCCSPSSFKLSGSIALALRGECDFTTKAKIAQEGGAAALVVINTQEGLMEMGCSNDTALNISIPVITISESGGEELNKSMADGMKVELLLYSPTRPIVDYSVVFLWLMSIGSIVTASLWSEITESKQRDGSSNELSPKVP
ncbi:Mannosyl-oligosaccharide 1,2-alpha-mannosidase [Handroanthus impetiginosus]|uniref:Mannosyl-oligosaccharide 1,2-alpha-mannosidase n=1 Tax=Handroanthus impetiginosus TaxID=429701 RepID=A0A2G9HKI7_9LAMI|nr:Mannosyl-oligosaccharide 1,2-alpha-mannosidase [Handroanthus impetiginosus]